MHKKIKQTGKTHTHDGIPGATLAVPFNFEAVIQQAGHSQRPGTKRILLSLVIAGINAIEMDFGKIAVKVTTNDFATWVEAVATQPMFHLIVGNGTVV
jgi:hypothetical protein